jgi:hypothetical protein
MNQKAFWSYAGIGAALALLAAYPVSCGLTDAAMHPDYKRHLAATSAHQAFVRKNEEALRHRLFEEVAAGTKQADALPKSELQEVARALAALRPGSPEDSAARSQAVSDLLISPDKRPRAFDWLSCERKQDGSLVNCSFSGSLAVLNDPARLAKLWSGVPEEVAAALTPLPEGQAQEPAPYPANAPTTVPLPPSTPWLVWAIISGFFAFGFFVSGMMFWSSGEEAKHCKGQNPWSHPFRTVPNFVFGWLFILAALPGYLAFRILHLFVLDAGPAAAWIKSQFVKKTFADEYEKFQAQLAGMKQASALIGDSKLIARIEDLGKKISEAQNMRQLSKMQASLEYMNSYLDSVMEVEREFGEITAV